MKKRIPIFLASDENYLPYLSVTVKSIDLHSSDDNIYDVYILCDGLTDEGLGRLSALELRNTKITVVNVTSAIGSMRSLLKRRLRDYYSESIFYRLFIADMFPHLDRAIYIDCDTVLVTDIAELYDTDMGDNILAAVADESIPCVPAFCDYVESWVGVPVHRYINSGVLVINLDAFRREHIFRRFAESVATTNPETIAPDQDYLNYLCRGHIHYLDGVWNKQPKRDNPTPVDEIKLLHFNLYEKPWHFAGVLYEEEFWSVARETPYYDEIKNGFDTYTEEERVRDAEGGVRLVEKAAELASMGYGMFTPRAQIVRLKFGGVV